MKLLILIGDRANEVAKAIGSEKTNNTEINNALETLVRSGYKRYRLMRVLHGVKKYPDSAEILCIPIVITQGTDQLFELTDQLNEWSLPIKTVAVIWDHYLHDSREYATWFGLEEDASIEAVNLAVNKCKEYEAKVLVPKCNHVFKLSRLTDNRYIKHFTINTSGGE